MHIFAKVIVNYKYIICQQKLNSIYRNVIMCFILTPFLTPNGSLMSVCCVYVQIWHLFHIRDRSYRIEINFCVCN